MVFEAVAYKGSPEKFLNETVEELKKSIDGNAFSFASGGVDSSASTALVHRAIGDRLHTIHFEHGGMRKGECKYIVNLLNKSGIPTEFRDYSDMFMIRVINAGEDAEAKRKAVRDTYFDALVGEAQRLNVKYNVQGTNAADVHEVLEKFLKSQHNVITSEISEKLKKRGIEVIEPVKRLYKNEVRQVARYLGLPPELTERQPFLGPGEYCRVVGSVDGKKMKLVKEVDYIATIKLEKLASELKEFADKDKQCFAGLMERQLEYISFQPKIDDIEIDNPKLTMSKVTGINKEGNRAYGRMLIFESYDSKISDLINISNKILSTDTARERNIVRCATVIDKYVKGDFIVPLRAVATTDFKTAAALPLKRNDLEDISDKVTEIDAIGEVVYDITHKPPSTIEWE